MDGNVYKKYLPYFFGFFIATGFSVEKALLLFEHNKKFLDIESDTLYFLSLFFSYLEGPFRILRYSTSFLGFLEFSLLLFTNLALLAIYPLKQNWWSGVMFVVGAFLWVFVAYLVDQIVSI